MDTLTHALSGALIGRATEKGSELPRRTRMWVGFWTAAFPDSDFILRFIDPFTYLTSHRGVTHSILLLPIWALALAFLLQLIYRGRYRWQAFFGICALGIGAHIAGDVITSFGTMIFAPFSTWRLQIPATFIIDPYFTAIIVMGLLTSWRWQDTRLPAILSLSLLATYVGFQIVLHRQAEKVGESFISSNQLKNGQAHALPQPFAPFNWMVVVEQPQEYHISYISLVRKDIPVPPPSDAMWLQRVYASYRPVDKALWQRIPRYGKSETENRIAMAAWNSSILDGYRAFAMFPSAFQIDETKDSTCVWFNDLRFALVERTNPFRYGACRPSEALPWKIQSAQ